MEHKNLQKASHFLSALMNIGCVIMGICSALLAIGIVATLCMSVIAPEIFQSVWNFGSQAAQGLSFTQYIVFLLCCLGKFFCIFFMLYCAKKIFGCIGKGSSPFTKATAIKIRKIGFWIIAYGGISLIFDYGCELQKEVDETL